jgi:TPR repeat protein
MEVISGPTPTYPVWELLYIGSLKRKFGAFQGRFIILIAVTVAAGEAFAADNAGPADAVVAENGPIAQLRRDAEHGNETAEYVLGCCYNGDRGFVRNPAEAAKWWGMAAAKGVADAQYCLGLSYYLGQGVARNVSEAAKWWTLAANQDHPDAQYFLGLSYRVGLGVPKNLTLASYWLNKSASHGNREALEMLKKMGAMPG